MKVVKHDYDRRRHGEPPEERRHRVEQAEALGFRVGVERVRQVRQPLCELRDKTREVATKRRDLIRQRVDRTPGDIRPQRLDERLVRDTKILIATAVQNDRAFSVRTTSDLRGETRFAYARLTRDQRRSPLASRRGLPRDPKSVLFRRSANEPYLTFNGKRVRQRETGINRQIPRDLRRA